MVLPLILIGLLLIWFIVTLIVTYWYIVIPLIITVYLLYRNLTKDPKKKEDNESRRSQSSSYENYSQSDYNSNHNSNSNDEYKKNTNYNSYEKINGKSKSKSKAKSKASQARENRVNSRLEKYQITPAEAKIIFGSAWRAKLGKQEWEFYYVVRYIEIDFEFDYNNRFRNKYGHLYSKVLQIIKIVMDENADLREKEGKRYRYDRQTYDDFDWDSYERDNYDWNNYDWKYKDYNNKSNFNQKSNFNNEDITKAYDLFGLTKESTKEQIKTKYRELTLKFHPDKNKSKDSTIKMTEINRAYEIIIEVLG